VIFKVGEIELGIKDPPLITTKIIDRLVSYVLYHTNKVPPDKRDMKGKRFT